MQPIEQWMGQLEGVADRYGQVLVAQQQMQHDVCALLDHPHSPLDGIVYEFSRSSPFDEFEVGKPGEGDPTDEHTVELQDEHQTQCKLSVWRKAPAARTQGHFDPARVTNLLSGLARGYWKSHMRDAKSWLPALQNTRDYQVADETVERWRQDNPFLFVVYCDLDNFKRVNDQYDHDAGDEVILQFAALLDKVVQPDGVALHRSGDEFVVMRPANALEDALQLAMRLGSELSRYDFVVKGHALTIKLGLTAGIAVTGQGQERSGYRSLERRAESATKSEKGEKLRGRARFEGPCVTELQKLDIFSLDLSVAVVKSGLGTPRPFESPWLNLVTMSVCERLLAGGASAEGVGRLVNELVRWMQPDLVCDVVRAIAQPGGHDDRQPRLSPLDIALAVAHGALRATLLHPNTLPDSSEIQVLYDDAGAARCVARGGAAERILMQYGEGRADDLQVLSLGSPFHSKDPDDVESISTRRAVLVKIGHEELRLPYSVFAEIIVVDDRPTRGGGLPDFWAAVVARLIAQMEANPNIACVYLLGDRRAARLTAGMLENVGTWGKRADEIAYKTGMSEQSIRAAAERLSGKVFFPASEEELAGALAGVLRSACALNRPVAPRIRERRFLERDLRVEDIALGRNDGCRVPTIAAAYPIVLEAVRKWSSDESIVDQAGHGLRELIDFKVVLTTPRQDLVPAFYDQQEEKDSLEEYFRREFLNDTGLFGKRGDVPTSVEIETAARVSCGCVWSLDTLGKESRRAKSVHQRAVAV